MSDPGPNDPTSPPANPAAPPPVTPASPQPPGGSYRRRKSDRMLPRLMALRLKLRKYAGERRSPLWRAAILIVAATACAELMGPDRGATPVLEPGGIAPRTVWARRSYRILDQDVTATKRAEAERSVRAVYDYDPASFSQTTSRLVAAFESARSEIEQGTKVDGPAIAARFAERASIPAGPALDAAVKSSYDVAVERGAIQLLESISSRKIVGRADLAAADLESGIVVRVVGGGPEQVPPPGDRPLDVDAARTVLVERGALSGETGSRRSAAVAIASAVLRPNLTYNAAETELRRQKARESVNEVYIAVQKGRAVLEAGHEVTPEQARLLVAMRDADEKSGAKGTRARIGLWAVSASILGSVWAFGRRYMRRVPVSTRDLAVLATLVVVGLALERIAYALSGVLPDAGGFLAPLALRYAVPGAATAIVAAVLFGAEGAALVATATALLAGLALEGDLKLTVYLFLGSIAAAGVLSLPQRRSDLLKAGLAAAGAQIAIVTAFVLAEPPETAVVPLLAAAAASGLAAGVLALGLLPAFEAFGYLTNFKLLELASLGSPLLKDLSIEAPGTYHHSVMVGALAEAGASAVGANPLFARVACYYHDIGKMKKPQYFIENQQGAANPHDRLTPSMSALVVESHVRDGIEMGLAHGLPKGIVDVIPQHHGTKLISFFYTKAKKAAEADPESGDVHESDFRYPGPKPQSPEAGVIMLADGVEAATRSISEPTPAKVRAMVKKVFSLVQDDGQLDECDLSLKDLAQIGESFEQVLLAIHHRRVAYPATAEISTGGVIKLPTGRRGGENRE